MHFGRLLLCAVVLVCFPSRALAQDEAATATTAPAGAIMTEGLDADGTIAVELHKTRVVHVREPLKRLVASNPDIAEINVVAPTQFVVTGKSAGETSVTVWIGDDTHQTMDVRVVSVDDAAPAGGRRRPPRPWVAVEVTASAISGFVCLKASGGRTVHVNLERIAAVEVDADQQQTRLLFAADSPAELEAGGGRPEKRPATRTGDRAAEDRPAMSGGMISSDPVDCLRGLP